MDFLLDRYKSLFKEKKLHFRMHRMLYSFIVVFFFSVILIGGPLSPSNSIQSSSLYAQASCSCAFNASKVLKQYLSVYHSCQ